MIVTKSITKADNNIYQVKRKEIFNSIFCTIHDLVDVFNAMYRIEFLKMYFLLSMRL